MSLKKFVLLLGLMLLLGLGLAACGQANPTPAPCPTCAAPEVQTCPEQTPCPEAEAGIQAPFVEAWQGSGHADAEAAAFTHWNEEDTKEVPVECAKCHSTTGFQDYVGADGSEAYKVDAGHPVGTTVECQACHNGATLNYTTVQFPSGAEVSGLGREAVCMTCHQGTASGVQVDETIAAAGLTDDDTVSTGDAPLGFVNIHYYAAAVSRYGKLVAGGYQYEGKSYDALFDHVEGYQACQDCHDPHSLEIKVDECAACHTGVASVEDLRAIRMQSSLVDYDGDGDLEEGVAAEIDGIRELLYTGIQAYAKEVAGASIVYDAATYPYFFTDTNDNGTGDADELQFPNSYKSWTGRLEKAAFNFQTSIKDPGGYAHGGKYIIELLYDSIENLNEAITDKVDLAAVHREDMGHFDGASEAFRHWDGEEGGVVPAGCVKCHSAAGLPMFLANNSTISVNASNGLMCSTCHSSLTEYTLYEQEMVTFPSGAKLGFEGDPASNLCLNCHQGRESTVSVNNAIKNSGLTDDQASDKLAFRNVHYFAAGATLFGTEAKGMYEYAGKEYNGKFAHVQGFDTCASCHDAHALQPKLEACAGCHGTSDFTAIRGDSSTADFDGDGDVTEGIAGEVATMQEVLMTAMQAYAADTAGSPIVYNGAAYPYWFIDANADGAADEGDTERFVSFTPTLLKGAYNYQFSVKDPGAAVHNGKYVMQVLYDTIQDLGGDVTGMTRP